MWVCSGVACTGEKRRCLTVLFCVEFQLRSAVECRPDDILGTELLRAADGSESLVGCDPDASKEGL
jgi:hypothetical protein